MKNNEVKKLQTKQYVPKVGDSIAATRKFKSSIYHNHNFIVGHVVEVWSNTCQIIINQGTEIEDDFRLYFDDWNFQFLHKTND